MTPALAQALSLIAPQYNAAQHTRAAERMVQDMEKMITKQKLSPSAIDVRLSVWGPKKEGAPDIDYPQNYLVMPEETAYTTKEFVPVYAICESSQSACLFASAPDLLRALEDALPTLQSHMERYPNDKDERRIYDAARAAIDKARGK